MLHFSRSSSSRRLAYARQLTRVGRAEQGAISRLSPYEHVTRPAGLRNLEILAVLAATLASVGGDDIGEDSVPGDSWRLARGTGTITYRHSLRRKVTRFFSTRE